MDELLNDYIYVKKCDFNDFQATRNVIDHVELDYERIFQFSRSLHPLNSYVVNPLYVKLIEVQK